MGHEPLALPGSGSSSATGEKPPSTQPSASPGCRDGRRGSLDGSGTMGSGSHSARGCLRGGVGRASRGRGADVTARGVLGWGGGEVLAAESGAVHQGGTGPGVSGVPSTSRKVHSLTQHRQPVVPLVYSLP